MKNQKFFEIFLLFILFAYCVHKAEGGSDDETKVNEVINEGGEGSGTQESGNTRKYKSSKNRRTVRRRERKKKLEGGIAAMERGNFSILIFSSNKNINIIEFQKRGFYEFSVCCIHEGRCNLILAFFVVSR